MGVALWNKEMGQQIDGRPGERQREGEGEISLEGREAMLTKQREYLRTEVLYLSKNKGFFLSKA
jgi:hypothetical protein